MHGTARKSLLLVGLVFILMTNVAMAQSLVSKDYLQDCAECHGADGKGAQPQKRAVRGYISVDLTQLSKRNGGEFPRQKVHDAIDGRHRIAAHFRGSMPRWGARYSTDERDRADVEQHVHARIAALVDFIESMQEK